MTTWYELPEPKESSLDWDRLIRVRETVSKSLEDLRVDDVIGSGLDAGVEIFADGSLSEQLQSLGDELRFVFITSEARVRPATERPDGAMQADGYWVAVSKTASEKCTRCWHRREDVGAVSGHPEICTRCAGNVDGPGEERRFA